jgi:hypothetical protein
MVRARWWLLLLLAVGTAGTTLHAQEINWQEAVARLARERTLAETCVALLKQYGNQASQARGSITYGEAKAEYDGVIAGLVVALARKGQPESLPDLQDRLQRRLRQTRRVLPQRAAAGSADGWREGPDRRLSQRSCEAAH